MNKTHLITGIVCFTTLFPSTCPADDPAQKLPINEVTVTSDNGTKTSMHCKVPAQIEAGQPVIVEIQLSNDGPHRVYSGQDAFYGSWHFKLTDEKGVHISPTRYGKWRLIEQRENAFAFLPIENKRPLTFNVNLSRLFDVSEEGKYILSANRSFNERGPLPFSLRMRDLSFEVVRPTR